MGITIVPIGFIAGAGAPNFLNSPVAIDLIGPANRYACVTAFLDNSLTIIDVSNPTSPSFVGNIAGAGSPNFLGRPGAVFVSGNYAYVAATGDNSLTIIDISNPASPSFVGNIAGAGSPNFLGGATGVYVSGTLAYVTANTDSSMTIIDVSTPSAPTFVGNVKGAGPGGIYPVNGLYLAVRSGIVYEADNNGMTIMDASTPSAPTFLSHVDNNDYFQIQVSGNVAYVADEGRNTFTTWDITTPSSPNLLKTLTPTNTGAPNFLGNCNSVDLILPYVIVTAGVDGTVTAIDVTDPSKAFITYQLFTTAGFKWISNPRYVRISGNYAYVCGSDFNALSVLQLNITGPSIAGVYSGNPSIGLRQRVVGY